MAPQRGFCFDCGKWSFLLKKRCYLCFRKHDAENKPPVNHFEHRAARRGWGDSEPSRSGQLPAEPTDAVPGSDEKKEVLAKRAEEGTLLHHPQDVSYKFILRRVGIFFGRVVNERDE